MKGALPRSTPEQRSPFYEDTEALISPGFLAHSISIQGISLSFRSLGPGDIFLLRARVGNRGRDEAWKIWSIASSIWMINGYVVLGDANVAPRLAEMVRRLPRQTREILFSLVMGLFARQNRASDAVEPYCYESLSRYRWKSHGRQVLSSHAGIPGAEVIGSNHIQRMWTFYNEVEDQRHEEDTLWEGFKLSISPHAPKGVKKIDSRDRQVRQTEIDRRLGLLDRFYYTNIGVIRPVKKGEPTPADQVGLLAVKSVEDLEDEMKRWVTGQEDWHDKVVNDYKRRILVRYDEEKRIRAARAAVLQAAREQESMLPQSRMVGYTAEQLSEMLQGRQPGVRSVGSSPHIVRESLYGKYLEKSPDSGLLHVVNGKLIAGGAEGGEGLADQIEGRQVPFHLEPER